MKQDYTLIHAHSRAARVGSGYPGQAIECHRALTVGVYRRMRADGLTPSQARDHLFLSVFIGLTSASRFVADPKAVAA